MCMLGGYRVGEKHNQAIQENKSTHSNKAHTHRESSTHLPRAPLQPLQRVPPEFGLGIGLSVVVIERDGWGQMGEY